MKLWVLLLLPLPLVAQDYGARLGTVKRGGKVSFEPRGPGVLFDALDPAVRKWYIPQELYAEHRWKQWEYSNYARNLYQRYVSTSLEGNYIYDVYGNYLTRGWPIFDWRQQNPQPFGSTLALDRRFVSWFNQLLIASDHKGEYHYAITIGSHIRTTLTPMTFSKPRFNGIQWDLLSDKYALTMLLSRLNSLIRRDRPANGHLGEDQQHQPGRRSVRSAGRRLRQGRWNLSERAPRADSDRDVQWQYPQGQPHRRAEFD